MEAAMSNGYMPKSANLITDLKQQLDRPKLEPSKYMPSSAVEIPKEKMEIADVPKTTSARPSPEQISEYQRLGAGKTPEGRAYRRQFMSEVPQTPVEPTEKRMGLPERATKQTYQAGVVAPIAGLPDLFEEDKAEDVAYEIQNKRMAERKKAGIVMRDERLLKDEWDDILKALRLPPQAREDEDLKGYPQIQKPESQLAKKIAVEVPQAETLGEKITDIGANLAGFIGQVAVMKKVMPGAPMGAVWEAVNIANGGQPGQGSAMYATLGLTKGIPSKIGRTAVESTIFGGQEALAGGTPTEIATAALIPPALTGIEALKGKISPTTKAGKALKQPKPQPVKTTVNTLMDELKKAVKQRKKILPEIQEKYRMERGARAAKFAELRDSYIERGMDARQATLKAQKAFAGKLMKKPPEGIVPKLSDQQWNQLQQEIVNKFPKAEKSYNQTRASSALEKIKTGQPLQKNEIKLLGEVFGMDLYKQLYKELPFSVRAIDMVTDIGGALKTVVAGGDISFGGRQILPVFYRHPIAWAKATGKQIGAFFSQRKYDEYHKQLQENPRHEQAKKYGVDFTDISPGAGQRQRPEQFPSKIAEKWPLIKRGNRAADIAGNAARQSMWDLTIENWQKKKVPLNRIRLKKLASYINDLTGRSKIPKNRAVRGLTDIANITAFSPRFAWSRIKNVTTLFHTLNTDKYIRREGAKALAGWMATNAAILGIAKLFGADTEIDPRSADFGKIKSGNTRYDVMAGHAQVIRLLAQFITGQTKTAAGKTKDLDRREALARFVKSKRSSLVSLIMDLYTGKKYIGEVEYTPKGMLKELYEKTTYLWLQDAIDAYQNDSLAQAAVALPASISGIGVSSYPESAFVTETKTKDQYARQEFNKEWDDLSPIQQKVLSVKYQDIGKVEFATKVERQKEPVDKVDLREQVKAEKYIYGKLKPELSKALKQYGISLKISRKIGDWYLNDDRYEQYKNSVIKGLNTVAFNKIIQSNIPDERKAEIIKFLIDTRKEIARNIVKTQANIGK
jgi:hypothetical protein